MTGETETGAAKIARTTMISRVDSGRANDDGERVRFETFGEGWPATSMEPVNGLETTLVACDLMVQKIRWEC